MSVFPHKADDNIYKRICKYEYDGVCQYFLNMTKYAQAYFTILEYA